VWAPEPLQRIRKIGKAQCTSWAGKGIFLFATKSFYSMGKEGSFLGDKAVGS